MIHQSLEQILYKHTLALTSYSSDIHVLNSYYMPDAVLSSGTTAVNKIDHLSSLMESWILYSSRNSVAFWRGALTSAIKGRNISPQWTWQNGGIVSHTYSAL